MLFFVPHVFMARLDISAYYRHFMVHPSQWCFQTFRFNGKTYVDTRLEFGSRIAPEVAHRVTMFVKRVLYANGLLALCCVMDDYLMFHMMKHVCRIMLAVSIALLQDLGFAVNMLPGKTVEPARSQKFLGVILNSARMSLSLPANKLQATLQAVTAVLAKKSVTHKVLQSLHGRLQWASRVVFGGKAFMRSLSDAMWSVSHPGHHVKVSREMRADLGWWQAYATLQNGVLRISPQLSTHYVYTDACLAPIPCIGFFHAGAFAALDRQHLVTCGLQPPLSDFDDINLWECFAIYVVLSLLPDVFATSRVLVYCDNAAAVAWVTGGAPRPLLARTIIQHLFELCLKLHIRLSVVPIAGEANVLADAASRRHWQRFGMLASRTLECDSAFLSLVLPSFQV